ncbi:MAG: MBL fold metallo-hydrolase RNA specificity domain-containing protein, partial [Candidatus Micrarchaeota archaeon]
PKREDLWEDIAKWTQEKLEDGIVVFGAYTRGKSQEITAILNRYAGVRPFVHENISRINSVYNRFGARLEFTSLLGEMSEEQPGGNFVAVMPPQMIRRDIIVGLEAAYGKKVYTALTTGWAMKGWGCADRIFPLSDHADFKDILEYVELSNPRRVFCCHGNERALSRILKEKGYDAIPIRQLAHEFPQTTLADSGST